MSSNAALSSCKKNIILYGWAASLYLDGSNPHLFVGCRSTFACDRASAVTSDLSKRVTTYAIVAGEGNPGQNGQPVLYNKPIRIAQARGGSDCNTGNFISVTFVPPSGINVCIPAPAATFRTPGVTPYNNFLIVPIVANVGAEVTYNEPFNLMINGPTLTPGPWWLGPPDSDGDLTTITDKNKAAKFQFWLGDTYVPDKVTCTGECYQAGSTCHNFSTTLCPDAANPNSCANTTIRANCTTDSSGQINYDCSSAAPCTASGTTCNDLAPQLCPNPNAPTLCLDGSTAICSLGTTGVPTYACPKKNGGLSTAWIIGIVVGSLILLIIIAAIITAVSRKKSKGRAKPTEKK